MARAKRQDISTRGWHSSSRKATPDKSYIAFQASPDKHNPSESQERIFNEPPRGKPRGILTKDLIIPIASSRGELNPNEIKICQRPSSMVAMAILSEKADGFELRESQSLYDAFWGTEKIE